MFVHAHSPPCSWTYQVSSKQTNAGNSGANNIDKCLQADLSRWNTSTSNGQLNPRVGDWRPTFYFSSVELPDGVALCEQDSVTRPRASSFRGIRTWQANTRWQGRARDRARRQPLNYRITQMLLLQKYFLFDLEFLVKSFIAYSFLCRRVNCLSA